MDENSLVDIILAEWKKDDLAWLLNRELSINIPNTYHVHYDEYLKALTRCLKEKLIEEWSERLRITYEGRNLIREHSSYVNYTRFLENEARKKQYKERKELEKLEGEVQILNWQKKTFWIFFWIALIGGLSGMISLILQMFFKSR